MAEVSATTQHCERSEPVPEYRIKECVRSRDMHRCRDCGKSESEIGETLHVHRLIPGSEYAARGCLSLCQPCHVKRHNGATPTAKVPARVWPAKSEARIKRFLKLEIKIVAGIEARTFLSVVEKACWAAKEVRDDVLYRDAGYESWTDCCVSRWRFSSQTANEMIAFYARGSPCFRMEKPPSPLSDRSIELLAMLFAEPECCESSFQAAVALPNKPALSDDPTKLASPCDSVEVPYISTALNIVWLGCLSGKQPPTAFWFRHADGTRECVYRLTKEAAEWVLWKCERVDQKWMEATRPGGAGLNEQTQAAMRAVASRLPAVHQIARECGALESLVDVQRAIQTRTQEPRLPPPPISLAALEHATWCEAESGYPAWVERRYGRRDLADNLPA